MSPPKIKASSRRRRRGSLVFGCDFADEGEMQLPFLNSYSFFAARRKRVGNLDRIRRCSRRIRCFEARFRRRGRKQAGTLKKTKGEARRSFYSLLVVVEDGEGGEDRHTRTITDTLLSTALWRGWSLPATTVPLDYAERLADPRRSRCSLPTTPAVAQAGDKPGVSSAREFGDWRRRRRRPRSHNSWVTTLH